MQRPRGGSDKAGEVGRMAPARAVQATPRVHNTELMSSHESQHAEPLMGPMLGTREYLITPPSHNPYYNPQGGKSGDLGLNL